MNLAPVSNAPEVFSAPLVSAEKPAIFEKVFSAVSRALKWIRSLFTFVFPLKEKKVEPLPKRDIQIARRVLQIAEQAKPSPTRFIRTSIPQAIPTAVLSWFQSSHKPLSGFISKKAVDAASAGIVLIANAFFPAYSDAFKQAVALVISAPAVWYAADFLGYRQETTYFWYVPVNIFFYGVAYNVYKLGRQIFSHYQVRKQREAQKVSLAAQANL